MESMLEEPNAISIALAASTADCVHLLLNAVIDEKVGGGEGGIQPQGGSGPGFQESCFSPSPSCDTAHSLPASLLTPQRLCPAPIPLLSSPPTALLSSYSSPTPHSSQVTPGSYHPVTNALCELAKQYPSMCESFLSKLPLKVRDADEGEMDWEG